MAACKGNNPAMAAAISPMIFLSARLDTSPERLAGAQAKYLADKNQKIMGEIAAAIAQGGLFPLQLADANPRLQRVVVVYCGSGEHHSPAIAALVAEVFSGVSSLSHP